jgi:hypothetical protein
MESTMLQHCLFPQFTLCMSLPDVVPSSPNVLLALLSLSQLPAIDSILLIYISLHTILYFHGSQNYAISRPV